MGKIRKIPQSLIGKIAAGEVIERPASALKELIENSIDAGATSLLIYIKEYGLAEIKVVDNGEGISSEDIEIAFERHATSKLEKDEDLFNINTLGFRGEALYSIAQVSKIRILTQHREESIGSEVYIIGGEIVEKTKRGTIGTTIKIEDLFFNAPVRKKFLKSSFTERAHIIETVQNYALSFPQISFYLNIDGEEIFNLPSSNSVEERISQLFGIDFLEKVNKREQSKDGYKITLFWGSDELKRKVRTRQLIFVNKRPVRDPLIISTLYKAFEIKEGHPQFILFLQVPNEKVDFNVHPAKKEVRFRDFNKISELIFRLIERQKVSFVAEREVEWKKDFPSLSSPSQSTIFDEELKINKYESLEFLSLGDAIVAIKEEDGILFIDVHAVHERINYEKLLNSMSPNTYRLVFPEIINLNPSEYSVIKENLTLLSELGIEAEDFGKNAIIIRGVPEILKDADIAQIIESIAFAIKEESGRIDLSDIKKKVASTIACHSSLRANDRITEWALRKLLSELEKTLDSEHCPHGRPLKKFIPFSEIKRWFLR